VSASVCELARAAAHKSANELQQERRIALQPKDGDFPFEWRRRQFPVRVCFAMTINKSQGQTLQRAGVYLADDIFAHGQLYVAASRVSHPDHIRFALHRFPLSTWTKNIVYKQVIG